jgi:hypothetical protein
MRLRIGAVLWLMSWVPYGIILGLDGTALTVAWLIEILLGIAGLALAGSEFARVVKTTGWKHAPAVAWHALAHGRNVEDVPVEA